MPTEKPNFESISITQIALILSKGAQLDGWFHRTQARKRYFCLAGPAEQVASNGEMHHTGKAET